MHLGHRAAGAAAAAGAAQGPRGTAENEGNNSTHLSSGCHPDSTLLARHQHALGSCCARWLVPDGKGQLAQGPSAHFTVDQMPFEEL